MIQCNAIAVLTGKQCNRAANHGNVCFAHLQTQEAKDIRRKTARLAGSALTYIPRSKPIEIKDSRDLHKYLAQILTGMSSGKIRLTTSHLKDISNIGKLFVQTEEKIVILKRLEELEEAKQLP